MASTCRIPTQAQAVVGLAGAAGLQSAKSRLRSPQQQAPSRRLEVVAGVAKKKVNSYDATWKKNFFGVGYFAEESEPTPVDLVKNLEKKKILSSVEKSGLLSSLEKAGLSLGKIEQLKLLSTAESLGALSLAESLATTPPPVLASWSLPCVVAAISAIVFIPDDSTALLIAQYGVAGAFTFLGVTLFGLAVVLGGLND